MYSVFTWNSIFISNIKNFVDLLFYKWKMLKNILLPHSPLQSHLYLFLSWKQRILYSKLCINCTIICTSILVFFHMLPRKITFLTEWFLRRRYFTICFNVESQPQFLSHPNPGDHDLNKHESKCICILLDTKY